MIITFIIAVLTGLGVGSGGLFVIYLTLVNGLPQLFAQGLNLYFFIFSTAAAAVIHSLSKFLPLKRLALVCAFGGAGCILGGITAQNSDAGTLRTVFAFLLIITGFISFFRKK